MTSDLSVATGLAGVLSYGMVNTNARQEVLNEAAIMSGQANATAPTPPTRSPPCW